MAAREIAPTTNGVSDIANSMNGASGEQVNNDVPIAVTNLPPLKPIQETAAYKGKNDVAYGLSQKYFDTPRRVKIVVAGAGVSGIDLAHAVESGQLKNVDLRIYEKNAGLGGTWWENRYPGCACDIPSHNYLVSKLYFDLKLKCIIDDGTTTSSRGRQTLSGHPFMSSRRRSSSILKTSPMASRCAST